MTPCEQSINPVQHVKNDCDSVRLTFWSWLSYYLLTLHAVLTRPSTESMRSLELRTGDS